MQKDTSPEKVAPMEQVQGKPSGYRMFTDAQLHEIHLASLEILRRTGMRVHSQNASGARAVQALTGGQT